MADKSLLEKMRWTYFLLISSIILGCVSVSQIALDEKYGVARPRNRLTEGSAFGSIDFAEQVFPGLATSNIPDSLVALDRKLADPNTTIFKRDNGTTK